MILSLDITTARLPTLRTALKAADAYTGVSRLNIAELAEYARKVQTLRTEGETVAITAANVQELLHRAELAAHARKVQEQQAEPQPEPAAAPAKVRKASKVQERNDAHVQMLLAMGTVTLEVFTAVTGKTQAYYLAPGAWTAGEHKGQPSTWNPYYMACVRLGIGVEHAKVDGVAQVTLRKLDAAQAEAQRATLEAGRQRYAAAKAARKAAKAAAAA